METRIYYVIKPTTHNRKKFTYSDLLELTESQARPLRNGGFVTRDKSAADRIGELMVENEKLKSANDETTVIDKEVKQ